MWVREACYWNMQHSTNETMMDQWFQIEQMQLAPLYGKDRLPHMGCTLARTQLICALTSRQAFG